jgi:(p)ppGpp synthase/HD superfamily hydrolase
MTLIEKADQLAQRAHEGQTRKGSSIPYITHPRAVAESLKKYGFGDTVVAAALAHDVLEDTKVTERELGAELGQEVLNLVLAVSYDKSLSWEDARLAYIEAVRQASEGAKAISVADKIHNAESLLVTYQKEGKAVWSHFTHPRDKKLWFEEEMLKMLRESWQHPLVDEYAALVEQMEALDY